MITSGVSVDGGLGVTFKIQLSPATEWSQPRSIRGQNAAFGNDRFASLTAIRPCQSGGCNPSYDRVEYVREIQEAAGDRIAWVSLDEGGFTTILLVSGCDKQCVEMAEYEESGCRIIRIKDTCVTPSQILSHLLEGDS